MLRKPSTGTATAETQTNLSGNLILDDPETKDSEAQTIEEEDVVWVLHEEVQTSDDGIFYVDTPFGRDFQLCHGRCPTNSHGGFWASTRTSMIGRRGRMSWSYFLET